VSTQKVRPAIHQGSVCVPNFADQALHVPCTILQTDMFRVCPLAGWQSTVAVLHVWICCCQAIYFICFSPSICALLSLVAIGNVWLGSKCGCMQCSGGLWGDLAPSSSINDPLVLPMLM
jgi:hypothetical protein